MTGRALEIAPRATGRVARARLPFRCGDQLADRDDARRGVGDLDPHRTLSRDRCHDPDRRRVHRQRQVVGERGDPADLHARRGHDLELRDDRSGGPAGDGAFHLEGPEGVEQDLPEPVELGLAGVDVPGGGSCRSSIGGSSDSTSGSRRRAERPWRAAACGSLRLPADRRAPALRRPRPSAVGAEPSGGTGRAASGTSGADARSRRWSGCHAIVSRVSAESARKPSRRAPANPVMS